VPSHGDHRALDDGDLPHCSQAVLGHLIATTEIDETQFERATALIRTRLEGLYLPPDEAVQLPSAVQALMTGWSTFAHVPYARLLAELFDLDSIALKSLDALIAGWPYRETPAATD
jgi:hypothetical protein